AREPDKVVNYDTLEPDRKDYLEIARDALHQLHETRPRDWDKTWAHGVNSLGGLLEAKDLFAGVEIDTAFDTREGTFFVLSPSTHDAGLSLTEYMHASSSRPNLRLWFTWRNAAESFAAGLTELRRLDQQFDLRRRIIVETASESVTPAFQQLKA